MLWPGGLGLCMRHNGFVAALATRPREMNC
jgi:hypothetical protein